MPTNKSKIAKNAIALYVRMAIVLVVSLYTSRVVLNQLGASDYGTFNVVGGVITMLSFMNSALSQGIQRFYNYHKGRNDYENINKIFFAGIVVMAAVAIILVILAETVGLWFLNAKMNIPADRMLAANWVFQFSVLCMLFNLMIVPFNAMIVAHEDFGIYAYLSIGQSVLNLVIAFLLIVSPFDKLVFFSGLVCLVQLIYVSTIFIICRLRYKQIHVVAHSEKPIYQSLLSFSGWNILGTSMFMVGTQGVNIILNIFFGTVVNAARGIAVQISSKVDMFINNIQQAMNPQIVQLYSRGEVKELQSLVDDNFRWNFSLYWLIALPLLFEIDYILELWLGKVPEYTAIFTSIIVLRSFLKCFERPINSVNFAIGKMKWLNIFATASVVVTTILMCVLFYIGFPPYWAFLIDCLSISFCIAYYMSHARRNNVFSFRHFFKVILLPISIVVFVSLGTASLVHFSLEPSVLRLFVTLVLTTTASGLLICYVLLTKAHRKKILGIVRSRLSPHFNRLK